MFQKAYKKLIIFTLLSVVQCENKYLATMVLSIKKFYKDNIKRKTVYISSETCFVHIAPAN